jgi:energy-coupling factor transporter ATP-binding protein EcfA2
MGRLRGVRERDIRVRASQLLERLGVLDVSAVHLHELSKGTAQKVAIAQAFLVPVPLVILDEPRTGLDLAGSDVLDELIEEARASQSAIIICEHEAAFPSSVDRLLKLTMGRIERETDIPAGPIRRVLLRLSRTDSTDDELTDLIEAGCLAWGNGSYVVLHIEGFAVSDVLQRALKHGWSVDEVRQLPSSGGTKA